eukprot:UN06602
MGWLGVGVVRKSFAEGATAGDGGFGLYSQHAIFIDPSWDAKEPHFNLKRLNTDVQKSMYIGDVITIVVNNNTKEIHFYKNDDKEAFAEGDWAKLNYEPVCGYAILTTNEDKFTILNPPPNAKGSKKSPLQVRQTAHRPNVPKPVEIHGEIQRQFQA